MKVMTFLLGGRKTIVLHTQNTAHSLRGLDHPRCPRQGLYRENNEKEAVTIFGFFSLAWLLKASHPF